MSASATSGSASPRRLCLAARRSGQAGVRAAATVYGRTVTVDEPTTGLHFDDIRKLLGVPAGWWTAAITVIVIEHNLDVIKTADWVIDLGPEGGSRGGSVVATGTPEQVAQVDDSYTGQFLAKALNAWPGPALRTG